MNNVRCWYDQQMSFSVIIGRIMALSLTCLVVVLTTLSHYRWSVHAN